MADFFDALDDRHIAMIGKQPVFFVATAAEDARINLSPKGYDAFRVIAPDLPLRADPREVESWFECPLDKLMDASQWSRNEVFWKGAMREYLEMDHEGYRIWGVTAAICWNLSRRIEWLEARG